jgi:hypothetical protein
MKAFLIFTTSFLVTFFVTLFILSLFGDKAESKSIPCAKHTEYTQPTREKCLAQYKNTVRARIQAKKALAKRDKARWPARPVTVRDLLVRKIEYKKWASLALHEAGRFDSRKGHWGQSNFGVRWNTPAGWTWAGGLGIYQPAATEVGSPYGNLNVLEWPAQVLIAQRIRERYGLTAWTAYRENPGRYWNAPSVLR